VKETLAADTPRVTTAGHTFVAAAGWRIWTTGPATILEAPEGGSFIAFVDVPGPTADEAVAQAWAAYDPKQKRVIDQVTPLPDRDGWQRKAYAYHTSPSEHREVAVNTFFADGAWLVAIYDVALAVRQKRAAQEAVIYASLFPKGYERETFAGKRARPLDATRIAELERWVDVVRGKLDIAGAAIGIVQDGKVVLARGFGVRELGKPGKIDAKTKFAIMSVSKPLTTLMLAKLVDEKRLTWDTPITQLYPAFALGDASTTSRVLVKHLICACTGMPRRDREWHYEYAKLTAAGVIEMLATMQPTSAFGELFQYTNVLAAAGGYIGGHVAFPKRELGAAFDEAMRTRVLGPLGMTSTTFDLRAAQRGNFARAHMRDLAGTSVPLALATQQPFAAVRPTGGGWSTVEDLLRYVQLELDPTYGVARPFISKDALHARQAPQVTVAANLTYGMGLYVSTDQGLRVVSHQGDGPGYHSEVFWLPDHGVGAVVLTNAGMGLHLRNAFQRKLVEVLFDAKPEADAMIDATMQRVLPAEAARRAGFVVPADPAHAGKLASAYTSPQLGPLVVRRVGAKTIFDVGEWQTEVGTWKHEDGTISFIAIPGGRGLSVVPGVKDGKRTLVMRDAQHEYIFVEK
jgi:CubicO group peptidase (beta-lactamase class C family)